MHRLSLPNVRTASPSLCAWLLAFAMMCLPLQAFAGQDDLSPEVQALYAQANAAQARGDDATAIAKYKAMLRLAPKLAPAYNNLGMLYFNERNFPEAVDVLQRGLKVNPHMPSASIMLGSALFEMGQDEKALAPLEEGLRANPTDDHAEMTLARVQMNLKDFKSASTHLQNLVERKQDNQEAWYLLGKSYIQLSENALLNVSRINPNSVLSHEIAGELMESMQNLDGAVVEYKKAVDMAPDKAGTHYHLGNAFWIMGKWESARTEFQKELVNSPNNCTAMWKLAKSMLEDNQSAEDALPYLTKAVERCPTLAQAHVDRARALIKLNRQSEALPDLEIAEKDSPEEPSIHFLLASVYRSQGKPAEAQAEMQTYGRLQRSASSAVADQAAESMTIKSESH